MTQTGTLVELIGSGQQAHVVRLLGEGGQGSVFELQTTAGERLALKWYHPHTATPAQRASIADLVERGAPTQRFLWPLDVASIAGEQGFGYVMPLRPAQYVGLAALVNGTVEVPLRTLCTIGFQLADSYLRLHAQGLCYRDISFGNVFFDPGTGDTLICDNDNVGVEDESTNPVMGTKKFMAPEIVQRLARPNSDTDLYSLSVLLFYLFMVGHPLLGRREYECAVWDEHAESALFGQRPLFVFDARDTSNGPVPGIHDGMLANWHIYPMTLRRLFERAFTDGLRDPKNGRVRESQWRSELIRCRDLLCACERCGTFNFSDRDAVDQRCWQCRAALAPPLSLVFDTCTVVLSEMTEITPHHLGVTTYDFSSVIARVSRHPTRPGAWGLTNTGTVDWKVVLPDGTLRVVEPTRSVGLIPGTKIAFGPAVGRLVVRP